MSRLHLIRHAETDMKGTFCGHSDPPVNAAGKVQITDLLQTLGRLTVQAVYTSDLLRARTTAETLACHFAVPCFVRTALREIDFGLWEGLRWSQVEARDPELAARWVQGYPKTPAPQGESFAAFEARVERVIKDLRAVAGPHDILVVTHAGVMRSVYSRHCTASDEESWARMREYCCSFSLQVECEDLVEVAP